MENSKQQESKIGSEIDLIALARKIWVERKLVFRYCGIAAVVGLVIAFSIPKEYTTTVTLAPEYTGGSSRSLGGLSTLAGMAGINLGGSSQTRDALSPSLYPDIVASIPFTTELFEVPVESQDGKIRTTVYDYMVEYQKAPWWRAVLSLPMRIIGWVRSLFVEDKEEDLEHKVNPFWLSKKEARVIMELNQKISLIVDQKTYLVTLAVTMQDPLISATLTDTVLCKLQNYITKYRTDKSRNDLAYTEKLYNEAKENYYEAQKQYADYVDQNQNIMLRSVQVKQERLQNEMSLAYNLYNQTAQQLQAAKAKVQENTPVYAVVQTATVPLRASSPSKFTILLGCIFLGGIVSVGWILGGRNLLKGLLNKKEL